MRSSYRSFFYFLGPPKGLAVEGTGHKTGLPLHSLCRQLQRRLGRWDTVQFIDRGADQNGKMVSSRKMRVPMPSIPLGADPSLTNEADAAPAAAATAAATATTSRHDDNSDDYGHYHHHPRQHQNISDPSDDNNGSDEEHRRKVFEVIPPVRSPPCVKAAVATALEAERKMQRRRTAAAAVGETECTKSTVADFAITPPSSSKCRTKKKSECRAKKKSGPVRKNTSPAVSNAADYIGVTYSRARNQWQARVCILQKQQYCGRYRLAADAARAYDDTIKQLGLERESNFRNDAEYQRARMEEVKMHEEAAQRQKEMMVAARAAAGLGNAVPSYAPTTPSSTADTTLPGRSGSADYIISGTERGLADFREAKTPPPPVAKRARITPGADASKGSRT